MKKPQGPHCQVDLNEQGLPQIKLMIGEKLYTTIRADQATAIAMLLQTSLPGDWPWPAVYTRQISQQLLNAAEAAQNLARRN